MLGGAGPLIMKLAALAKPISTAESAEAGGAPGERWVMDHHNPAREGVGMMGDSRKAQSRWDIPGSLARARISLISRAVNGAPAAIAREGRRNEWTSKRRGESEEQRARGCQAANDQANTETAEAKTGSAMCHTRQKEKT